MADKKITDLLPDKVIADERLEARKSEVAEVLSDALSRLGKGIDRKLENAFESSSSRVSAANRETIVEDVAARMAAKLVRDLIKPNLPSFRGSGATEVVKAKLETIAAAVGTISEQDLTTITKDEITGAIATVLRPARQRAAASTPNAAISAAAQSTTAPRISPRTRTSSIPRSFGGKSSGGTFGSKFCYPCTPISKTVWDKMWKDFEKKFNLG